MGYFSGHYDDWIKSRMNGIHKYISPGYFKEKTLLELGCGYAHIGNRFYEMGANVTSSDARMESLNVANEKYPHIKTLRIDSDKDSISEKYDIIVHWGLLYHLNEIENHIEKVSQKCDVLLLETEVSDSDDNTFFIPTSEYGYDQAYNCRGIRPSPSYVERVLEKNGFQFKLIKDNILNSSFHHYDWDINNTNTWRHGLRRFWICWKNVESPLKIET
jgi:predicted TPR repeat methyltransferase